MLWVFSCCSGKLRVPLDSNLLPASKGDLGISLELLNGNGASSLGEGPS